MTSIALVHFDVATFLRDYWQKKPLLIRNPWSQWINPLDPDELAGLACEPEVESRLVIGAQGSWAVEHGPLAAARFAKLGQEPSTLLVQAVDHHVPQVAELIAPFRFIPDWRIDDIMVSYATDGGGVGPHFDQYDVFLIQGHGRRRWRVGQVCDADSPLLPHDELRLLANFEATDEWVLEPGDILYVPPRIAHDGVAVGDDCMTYSVGFRAPSRSELIAHYVDDMVAEMDDDDRYCDPELAEQANPGEISAGALATLHHMVCGALADRQSFARWFGEFSTTPKYPEVDWTPDEPISLEEVRLHLDNGTTLVRNPASRFSFIQADEGVDLFVDGHRFSCRDESEAFAREICAKSRLVADAKLLQPDSVHILVMQMANRGAIAFEQDD